MGGGRPIYEAKLGNFEWKANGLLHFCRDGPGIGAVSTPHAGTIEATNDSEREEWIAADGNGRNHTTRTSGVYAESDGAPWAGRGVEDGRTRRWRDPVIVLCV